MGWRGDAELYRILATLVGIKPHEADEMELHQLGIMLGADLTRGQPFDEELWEREKDTLPERVKKIKEINAEEDITEGVMRQMGIRTN